MNLLCVSLLALLLAEATPPAETGPFFWPEPCNPIEGAHPNDLDYEKVLFDLLGWPTKHYYDEKALLYVISDNPPSWSIGVLIHDPLVKGKTCLVYGAEEMSRQEAKFLPSTRAMIFSTNRTTYIPCPLAERIEATWQRLIASARARKDPPGVVVLCPHNGPMFRFRTRFGCAKQCSTPELGSPSEQATQIASLLRDLVSATPEERPEIEVSLNIATEELDKRLRTLLDKDKGEP